MNTLNRKLALPAILAAAVVLFGSAYALGRANMNPFRVESAVAGPMDSTALALSSHKRCGSLSGENKVDCYSKILDSLAAQGEVRVAMGTLARLGVLDVDVKRDGHVFAHGIGITAGKRGGDVAKTFMMCDESNQSGCYHGVIQALQRVSRPDGGQVASVPVRARSWTRLDDDLRARSAESARGL